MKAEAMSKRSSSFKSFWSSPDAAMSLGCIGCPEISLCGGQTINGSGFNCLDHCCGRPATCQIVCPNAQVFTDRLREVNGLELETPMATPISSTPLPAYVPMLFHGSARVKSYLGQAVCIPLYRFFDRDANCRFASVEDIADAYRCGQRTSIILSGVAQDHEVERWWKLEQRGRIKAIANLRRLGVAMVTTPNFSLTVDRPRWDDMHSMRRIACVYHEFVSEGQPAALHVNGRTQADFSRWTDYVASHPEVTHLSYEFTTGAKGTLRMPQHASWLIDLAKGAGRRLGLILRGGVQVAPLLSAYYDIVFIDSSPFEKAQHRKIATIGPCGQREWHDLPTKPGDPVDFHFDENVRVSELWFNHSFPKLKLAA